MTNIKKYFFFFLYYVLFKHFPSSSFPVVGVWSKNLRYFCCKRFFKSCGSNVNIEREASFGTGFGIEIGDNSGLGKYCSIPAETVIGRDVMMGPYVKILASNHCFSRIDIPMRLQGVDFSRRTTIEDDVWIGAHVLMMPGRIIKVGSIIAAGTVLTKDFPSYSIVGGNPGKVIRRRIGINDTIA